MKRFRLVRLILVAIAILSGAELGSRLDDWNHFGTPFVSTPSRDFDLTFAEPWGLRGKSEGRYRKWRLNAFGFRGPEISRLPAEDVLRIFVLGSSESFGVYERPEGEYPALLRGLCRAGKGWEAVNTSMAGMGVNRAVTYWTHWLRQFQPDVVLIYPNPLFYLREEVPELNRDPVATDVPAISPPAPRPRLLLRMVDNLRSLPPWMRKWNREREMQAVISAHESGWQFTTVPADRLEAYALQVAELCQSIRRDGAQPVLMTFAFRSTDIAEPDDAFFFADMQTHFPRSTPDMIGPYAIAANERLRGLSQELDIPLIDVDRQLTGRRELFADLVHFSDEGAAEMARVVYEQLAVLPGRDAGRHGERAAR